MMAAKAANMGPELMRFIEKSLLLQVLDAVWKEHLLRARPSAPGHRPARLRPARSAERIQERGLRAVQRDAGRAEGARDDDAGARVELAPEQPAPIPAGEPADDGEPSGAGIGAGGREPEMALEGAAAGAGADRGGRAADAGERGGSERSRHMAQCAAQRAVPVRIGEEVQALPRAAGVVSPALSSQAVQRLTPGDGPAARVIARPAATKQSRSKSAATVAAFPSWPGLTRPSSPADRVGVRRAVQPDRVSMAGSTPAMTGGAGPRLDGFSRAARRAGWWRIRNDNSAVRQPLSGLA